MNFPVLFLATVIVIFSSSISAIPPVNDDFTNRMVCTGLQGSKPVDFIGATIEQGEPAHDRFDKVYKSVWYTWTAPVSGEFGIDTRYSMAKTIIVVYTGNILSNLSRVSYAGETYVHFMATAGTTYQVAIGLLNKESPVLQMNYYQDPLSDYYTVYSATNRSAMIKLTAKGSIAYITCAEHIMTLARTNKFGLHAGNTYPRTRTCHGLTILNSKGEVIVSNIAPEDAGTQYDLEYFDGKYLYLYNMDTSTLIAYRVSKKGLKKIGFQTIDNVWYIYVRGNYIFIPAVVTDEDSLLSSGSMKVYDRKLKKKLWEHPFEQFSAYTVADNGYYVKMHNGEYAFQNSVYKKGTLQYTVAIPYLLYNVRRILDKKGNMLYWNYTSVPLYKTNSPVTLVSRKGKKIIDNADLPGTGNVFMHGDYAKNTLYAGTHAGGETTTIRGFKLSKKGITPAGSVTVDHTRQIIVYDSMVTAYQVKTSPQYLYGFTQFDPRLKKQRRIEPMAEVIVIYIEKDVFARNWIIVYPGFYEYHTKIFNRKGVIVEHVILVSK